MAFPDEWWVAVEVLFATASFGEGDYTDAVKAYRAGNIGRKNVLRARDFDAAARGVRQAMGGQPESVASALIRARWYLLRGIPPTFCRPAGWDYANNELELIRIARSRDIEPVFLAFDASGIDPVPGPPTTPNPWDEWRKLT